MAESRSVNLLLPLITIQTRYLKIFILEIASRRALLKDDSPCSMHSELLELPVYRYRRTILVLRKALRDNSGFEHIRDIRGSIQLRIRRVVQVAEPVRQSRVHLIVLIRGDQIISGDFIVLQILEELLQRAVVQSLLVCAVGHVAAVCILEKQCTIVLTSEVVLITTVERIYIVRRSSAEARERYVTSAHGA